MVSLADSLLSSSARKLRIRVRPDLTAQRQRYQGRVYWVVKDPVGLQYFRFQEEEYAILQMLDGETSLDEVKEKFEAQFPPQKITLDEIQQFLGMLHRSGLILAGVQGQGAQLLKRRGERRRRELLNVVTNILCIRFKGIDPERLLNWLYPKLRWFFSPVVFVGVICLMLAALVLVAVQFDTFRAKLPAFHQFFTPANALWLAVTLAVTKVLHEFGHGLSCKHFGGECHEMGIMLLVLTPCLYCNVSDSWMLPSKWQRAAIGAAGMYVEAFLASIATFLWWYSQPGVLNSLCLNIVFICSVSTVVFNGNPLLRYDGYYILADLVEIPNLRQKATSILGHKMGEWFLGLEPSEDPFLPKRNQIFFALYSVAAACYRWLVIFSILLFLYKIGKPYRLEVVGQIMAAFALGGLIFQPFRQLYKFISVPGRLDKVKKPRMYATVGGIVLLVAAVLFVPLPYHVLSTFEIEPHKAAAVYVEVPGKLKEIRVKSGDSVTDGQVLAELESYDLDVKIADIKGSRAQLVAQLETLQRQRFKQSQAASSIPELVSAIESKDELLRQKESERKRLTLVASRTGNVFPPPWVTRNEDPEEMLPTWTGIPLDRKNLGAYLEEGTLYCKVGDPAQLDAVLVIDQADIGLVEQGQQVEMKFDELPHDILRGTIEEISRQDLKVSSKRLSAKGGGELATKTDPNTGAEKPASTSYQARVPLDDPDGLLRLGLRGQAKVFMEFKGWQTIGGRIWRVITRTFNFKL
jgi:putative peptide zinc metalloprotease protein